MYYSVLRLPNGTELKGGEAGSTLKALTLHTAVNAGQEFTIGSAFSDYIEAEIWADPGGSLQITAGEYQFSHYIILPTIISTAM